MLPHTKDCAFDNSEAGLSLAPLSSGGVECDGLVLDEGMKDGIGEAALEYAESFASLSPPLLRRSIIALADGSQRAWVSAIWCNAALIWRFPVRLNRCLAVFDDHTGNGAVPL